MAFQWMDDFQGYSAVNTAAAKMSDGPYSNVSQCVTVADPVTAGVNVMRLDPVFNQNFRRILSATQTTLGVAQRYYLSALPSATSCVQDFFQFQDTNNVQIGYIACDPSGYLGYYRNAAGSQVLLAQTSSPVITTGTWRHLEAKVVLHATAGSVEIRQDGFVILLATGLNTLGTTSGVINAIAGVSVGNTKTGSTSPPTYYIKDFIIWDTTGAANNDFLGTVQVYRLAPDSDVSLNWTPSSGTTGFNLINETVPDDDTSYIQAPTPSPAAAQFTLGDLPASTTSVKGVMIVHRSKKSDAGDAQVQASLISGASTGNGTDRAVSTAYAFWTDIFDQDPGGTAWSKTLVNALKLKLNRTV